MKIAESLHTRFHSRIYFALQLFHIVLCGLCTLAFAYSFYNTCDHTAAYVLTIAPSSFILSTEIGLGNGGISFLVADRTTPSGMLHFKIDGINIMGLARLQPLPDLTDYQHQKPTYPDLPQMNFLWHSHFGPLGTGLAITTNPLIKNHPEEHFYGIKIVFPIPLAILLSGTLSIVLYFKRRNRLGRGFEIQVEANK